ncbi:MAG: DNA-binding protein WhiA [Clostridia bacterium]|nr:DNA-binding protein WhiA [Clostridia bacterium]
MENTESFSLIVKKEIEDIFFDDERKELLKKAFLTGGSIADPKKSYHLEILTDTEKLAKNIISILKEFGIEAKFLEKKYKYVVYIKSSEAIALFLNVIGAHNALFKYEDEKVMHEINNNINRVVNCETANIEKVVETALRQIEIIKKIGIENLPENLQEVARIRVENPEMSLKEIGDMMTPKLGKSGVNHRLKKIEKLAEE